MTRRTPDRAARRYRRPAEVPSWVTVSWAVAATVAAVALLLVVAILLLGGGGAGHGPGRHAPSGTTDAPAEDTTGGHVPPGGH